MSILDKLNLGQNVGYIEELFELYSTDPGLVSESWAEFFSGLQNGSHVPAYPEQPYTNGTAALLAEQPSLNSLESQSKVSRLINAYRAWGHAKAKINPLKQGVVERPEVSSLDFNSYAFSKKDLQSEFFTEGFMGEEKATLSTILENLEKIYANAIGFEYFHILDQERREWLQGKIENRFSNGRYRLSPERRERILGKLIDSEAFESELHRKYIGHKRFSLEGGETLIPMLDTLLEESGSHSIKEIVIGMSHRGRLNVLTNTLGKPLQEIFSEFEDDNLHTSLGSGDVKYHLGYKSTYKCPSGENVGLLLAPNPSHLEFVDPVVEGISRAKQDMLYSGERGHVLPVLIHGDAAFAGQGVVYETLNFSAVPGYSTGGTVHVIVNNQIGFTTSPDEGRSATYATDVAKVIDAPVFHVNCENVEAACWAMHAALEYRMKFGRDVVLDLYCYRKYGHNEGDDPSFTQPLLYDEIKKKKPVAEIYAKELIASGYITEEKLKELQSYYKDRFDTAHRTRPASVAGEACAMHGILRVATPETGVPLEHLKKVASTLINHPDGFVPHPKLQKILEKRVDSLEQGEGIDWGFAEGLAFGSLVLEGKSVRLSGQDCGRGTFSQRHLALDHFEKMETVLPFSQLSKEEGAGNFEVINSTLSEAGIMGFEFGYSTVASNTLVLWEAQFGDFGNGAQVIIDQFISSSEAKWFQLSGLVLLLPHGFEGQGPEHSSARLERYLQLCAEGNIVVCVPSSANQHFHLLRRQGLADIKRPLVVMTPKSLLRHSGASCKAEDLTSGQFQTVIEEKFCKEKDVEHIVFLSGKIYYDVRDALSELESPKVKLVRVEQLYPFPQFEIKKATKNIKAKTVSWVQEEPRNMGAWTYIEPYFRHKIGLDVNYIGRPVSSSVATGSSKRHAVEQKNIVQEVLETVGVK